MVIGVSSLVAFREGIEKALYFAQENEFDHVNIFVSEPHFPSLRDQTYLKYLRNIAYDLSLSISLKAPAFTQNLSSLDKDIGRIALKYYEQIIDIANILDSSEVIIRTGMVFYPEKLCFRDALKVTITRLEYLLDKARNNGVRLLIENYPYDFDIIRNLDDVFLIKKHLREIRFALNIPHLFALKKNESELNKINYIDIDYMILGPPPSPYHVPYDVKKLRELIALYHDVIRIKRGRLILAAIRKDIVLKMKKLISEK